METGDVLAPNAADASVRPARAGDAAAMGAVQLRSWRRAYGGLMPAPLLDRLEAADLAAPWHAAVTAPPSPRHAVLVACAGAVVVGLAALAPSADPDAAGTDAELVALEVDPVHQRAGHGSRLLAAVAESAAGRGFTALRVWSPTTDGARLAFLTSAGLRPDGARRRLRSDGDGGDPSPEAVEERLAAALPA